MVRAFLCGVVLLLLIRPCTAQTNHKSGGQVASPSLPRLAEVVRVEARPRKGFLYPYYLYVPPELWGEKGKDTEQTLLVLPNNTGKPDDDFAAHDNYARRNIEDLRRLGSNLKVALLMPAFPRPQTDWRIYTHALDRDSLLTERKEYRRFDRQLIRMIDDARARLRSDGYRFDKRVLMFGFSASGMFTNRFTFLHPGRVKAAAVGSPGGWAIAPVDSWKGKTLRYPIGVADLKAVSGEKLDVKGLRGVPLFLFLGAVDDNDSVIFRDSYESEDEKLIFDLFGKTLIERWAFTREMYGANLPKAVLKVYPNVGHSLTKEMWDDIKAFFIEHLRD
jgi:pimeloyl-ACP methyl ester carboxylesterase